MGFPQEGGSYSGGKKYGKYPDGAISIPSDPGQRTNESSGCLVASTCFLREDNPFGTAELPVLPEVVSAPVLPEIPSMGLW